MDKFKSGFVAIIGRPNTGKSTLLNSLASKKIAIVSDKPQTTRHSIRAIINLPNPALKLQTGKAQIVFIDTPGFHKPKNVLGEQLNKRVLSVLKDVDAVLFIMDGSDGIGRGDQFLVEHFKSVNVPVVALINKADLMSENRTMAQITIAEKLAEFKEIIPVSALTGQNIDKLIGAIYSLLPEGPQYYPEGTLTDQPETVLISELIREKIMTYLQEEVPYSVFVDVEEVSRRPNKNMVDVTGIIYTEKESQKGILIGKEGLLLKKILTEARHDIESLLGSRIFLQARVKVYKNWQRDKDLLKKLNY
jgi:GTP-binding protein Era